MTLQFGLGLAVVGGAIGGVLICHRPWLAGLVGGIIAGPLGFLGVYYWSSFRNELWTLEIALAQGIASLPGVGVGILIRKLLAPPGDRFEPDEDEDKNGDGDEYEDSEYWDDE